jgi:exosome complex component RRP45
MTQYSGVERDFVLTALAPASQAAPTGDATAPSTAVRQDGRGLYDMRPFKLVFGPGSAGAGMGSGGGVSATVHLGKTRCVAAFVPEMGNISSHKLTPTHRVLANVSCEMVAPGPSARNEGSITFDIDFSPMANASWDLHSSAMPPPGEKYRGGSGPVEEEAVLLSRLLERGLRKSQAVDLESLCIIPGLLVWQIRCDIHVLDHDGNVLDAACIAAVAALMRFRRPDVSVVEGTKPIVHAFAEKQGLPLSIYHVPICVNFAFFHQGYAPAFCLRNVLCLMFDEVHVTHASHSSVHVVDPLRIEEACSEGTLAFITNSHHDLCTLSKAGGIALAPEVLMHCVRVAQVKTADITRVIKEAVANSLSS